MNDEQFMSSREFCETPEGRALFTGTDLFLYHIRPLRCRLIEAGAIITVGTRVKVRPKAFLREWKQISLEDARGDLQRPPRVPREPIVKRVHVSQRPSPEGQDDPLGMKRSADLSSQAHQQAREFMKRTQRVRGKV